MTVLSHVSRWACSASMALQQWWAAASPQLEGLDPAPPRETLEGNARSRLEVPPIRSTLRIAMILRSSGLQKPDHWVGQVYYRTEASLPIV